VSVRKGMDTRRATLNPNQQHDRHVLHAKHMTAALLVCLLCLLHNP